MRASIAIAAGACAGLPLLTLLAAHGLGADAVTALWLALVAAGAVSLAVIWVSIRTVVKPIEGLIRYMRSFSPDADAQPLVVAEHGEIGQAIRRFEAVSGLMKARARQVQHQLEAAREATKYSQLLQAVGIEIGGEMAAFSLSQLNQLALDRVRDALGADLAILCLHDEDSEKTISATSGLPKHTIIASPPRAPCSQDICKNPSCPVLADSIASRFAVPVAWGSMKYGELCVGYVHAHVLSKIQQDFLRDFCHMLAIGISNARLHWNLETLATLEERERIAGDLHDGIIQSLYGTGLGLLDCIRLIESSPGEARDRLQKTIDDLNSVIRDVRSYIAGLESEALRQTSLTAAVSDFMLRMSLDGALKIDLELRSECDALLTRDQSGHLFQICREAFFNIVKHAHATQVHVRLVPGDGLVQLVIEDDGQGFDLASRPGRGHGLKNIEVRARRIKGTPRIESTPGAGTRITIEVPLDPDK